MRNLRVDLPEITRKQKVSQKLQGPLLVPRQEEGAQEGQGSSDDSQNRLCRVFWSLNCIYLTLSHLHWDRNACLFFFLIEQSRWSLANGHLLVGLLVVVLILPLLSAAKGSTITSFVSKTPCQNSSSTSATFSLVLSFLAKQ